MLDENLPRQLKADFVEHQVFTVRDMGWNGIQNGELLKLLLKNKFDALLTFDKNLRHQQNFEKYPITVFVLVANINRYPDLSKLTPLVKAYLDTGSLIPGAVVIR